MKRRNSSLIFLSIIIYFLGLVKGYLSPIIRIDFEVQNLNLNQIEANLSYIEILENNILVVVCEVLGGIFLLPVINSLFFSGFTVGLTLNNLIVLDSGLKNSLLFILPHGILEIPAIIIAGAAGFKIPYEIVRYLAGKKETILTKEDVKEYLTLALISVVLIVIAAWIEANITLKIAKAMLNLTM